MGASTSRLDEDKALQLCRERKNFVQQALDGRCLLAAAHVSYVQSLKSTGIALRRFAETEVPVESSLYMSTSATPEQTLALIEKSVSHFSYSPPPASHSHHDTYSSSPSPPSTSQFQVNHMKFRGFSSKKVEEKPPVFIVATVTSSSSIPQSRSMVKMESNPSEESSSMPSETPPWRKLESEGKGSQRIDKTRAVVKDLYSRIRVAIHRIDSISRRIEELRDKELQPQLEELIEGLSRMWEMMLECHKVQFQLIKACYRGGNIKLNMQSELHRQVISHLEDELSVLAASFTKWITGQKSYIQAINNWLVKCVAITQQSSRRKKPALPPPLRHYGPPIYAACGIWLEKLEELPTKEVSSSVKALASDVARFLPRQEKNRNKKHRSGENKNDVTAHMLQEETLEDCGPGFDRFRTSLEGFVGQLNQFSESSVKMYKELNQGIQEAKNNYENNYAKMKAYSQGN